MTSVNIVSGFLGSGKTTLIQHLVDRMSPDKKIAVIENDFGEVGIDAALLRRKEIIVSEINAGCVCCNLTGNLRESIASIVQRYSPDILLLEPSGVARLSELCSTLDRLCGELPLLPGSVITLAAPLRRTAYTAKFSGIYRNQICNAGLIIPTHTENLSPAEKETFLHSLYDLAEGRPVLTRDWQAMDGDSLLSLGSVSSFSREADLHSRFLAGQSALFSSVSLDLPIAASPDSVQSFLETVAGDESRFGLLVRAKGFLQATGGTVKIDFADGAIYTEQTALLAPSRLVLIGCELDRDAIRQAAGEAFGNT